MSKIRLVPPPAVARLSMVPSGYVTADALRDGDPRERELSHLISRDGRYRVGVWSADPCSEYVDAYEGYEYAVILEGCATLTDLDGTVRTFRAGESFTIEPGWSGHYRVDERLTKQFVYYAPDEA